MSQPSTAEIALERDIFTYRAYMAQNKLFLVLDEIKPNSSEKLQPLRLLAEYLSPEPNRQNILSQLEQKLSSAAGVENETLVLVAAIIYMNELNYEAAFRVLHTVETLETMAFIVDIFLKLDRLDLAKKKAKDLQEKDDDATLTQLVQAWVYIAMVSGCGFFVLYSVVNVQGGPNWELLQGFFYFQKR